MDIQMEGPYFSEKKKGAQDKIGAIATGLYADFLVCSDDYSRKQVYLGGKPLTISEN